MNNGMQIPNLPLLLPLSLLLPLLLDASSTSDAASSVQQWVNHFSAGSAQVLQAVNTALTDVFKLAWITLISIGILLYLTHLNRRLGKDFIFGGTAMALLVQFIFPVVFKL